MGVDGKQAVVAKFPIAINAPPGSASTTDQEVSFAVSPDGCQLAATVITSADLALGYTSGTAWKLQTMRATVSGTAGVLHTWTSNLYPNSPGGFENLVLVGWDSAGPIVVVGSDLGLIGNPSSDFIANPDFVGGAVAHLAGDGTYGAGVGPPSCKAVQVSPRGDVACYEPGIGLSVFRSTGGTELDPVSVEVPGGTAYLAVGPSGVVALAGTGMGVAFGALGQWRGPNATSGTLPTQFYPEGWVDSRIVFGRIGNPGDPLDAALVRIGDAQPSAADLGFVGDFVGMLGG
jgi:hypothetical protein